MKIEKPWFKAKDFREWTREDTRQLAKYIGRKYGIENPNLDDLEKAVKIVASKHPVAPSEDGTMFIMPPINN